MRKAIPPIIKFNCYPIITVRNSLLTLQWQVKNAFFVYINNGIGFKKCKGEKLTIHNKSNTFKLIAFGWFGISVKQFEPISLEVNNKVPQAEFTYKKVVNTETNVANSIKLTSLDSFNKMVKIEIKNTRLSMIPCLESLEQELKLLEACDTTNDIEKINDKYHVQS